MEGPRIGANMLRSEYAAAERFGIDPDEWFLKTRHSRQMMTAYHIAKSSEEAMVAFDLRPKNNEK